MDCVGQNAVSTNKALLTPAGKAYIIFPYPKYYDI